MLPVDNVFKVSNYPSPRVQRKAVDLATLATCTRGKKGTILHMYTG